MDTLKHIVSIIHFDDVYDLKTKHQAIVVKNQWLLTHILWNSVWHISMFFNNLDKELQNEILELVYKIRDTYIKDTKLQKIWEKLREEWKLDTKTYLGCKYVQKYQHFKRLYEICEKRD